jgi:hypothetical protein
VISVVFRLMKNIIFNKTKSFVEMNTSDHACQILDCSLFWIWFAWEEKNQWYIVSQLLLEQNIWQAWSLVFISTKLLVLLKIIFFINLNTTEITSKIQISEIFCSKSNCETMYHWFFSSQANHIQNNEQSECLLRPQLFIPTVPV